MSDEPADDGYALGLLVDLRDLCRKIGDNNYRMAAELHDLLHKGPIRTSMISTRSFIPKRCRSS